MIDNEQPAQIETQYVKDATEAVSAARTFEQLRATKTEYWKQKREDLLNRIEKRSK